MRSDPNSLYFFPAIAFAAGIALGWLLATIRIKGRIRVSQLPSETSGSAASQVKRKTRKMEIKCVCGSLMRFRDPAEPGYQAYPTGNSVTCPNCGRTKDLTEIRKLEGNAQA